MIKLLYISSFVPYKRICHGGGQTFNYYVKNISKDKDIQTKMIGFCRYDDKKYIDEEKANYECHCILTRGTFITNVKRVIVDTYGKIVKKHDSELSYYLEREMLKEAMKLKKSGYMPDVIVLEWTNIVLEIEKIKAIFPDAKYVASEHDVSFLGYKRKYDTASDNNKISAKLAYENMKEREIEALKLCDIAMPHNNKDKKLLVDNGVSEEKIHVLTPYYHDMRNIKREKINHDILFWGAMYRPENYEAAIWFIDNVMPLLEDTDIRFVVAGNRPPESLKERASKRIVITGYVENEVEYFEHSLCFVSPLLTGAGIKIKVIEALSAKIPVLTNEIGIEGIPAVDGISYFKCETAQDYERAIRNIIQGKEDIDKLVDSQLEVIEKYFNMSKSFCEYKKMLFDLREESV